MRSDPLVRTANLDEQSTYDSEHTNNKDFRKLTGMYVEHPEESASAFPPPAGKLL